MAQQQLFELSLNYFGTDYRIQVHSLDLANALLNGPEAAENFLRINRPDLFDGSKACSTRAVDISDTFLYGDAGCSSSQNSYQEASFEGEQANQQYQSFDHTIPPLDNVNKKSVSSNDAVECIWTKRKSTPEDIDATYMLLQLRNDMSKEFDDKKSTKSKLWQKIAAEISKKFKLGDNGGERCRQKFSNLIKPYLGYINNQKTTGSEKIETPPFFDEINAILGNKDKVQPQRLEDSLTPSAKTSASNEAPKRGKDDNDSSDEVENRFKTRNKRIRPLSQTETLIKEVQMERKKRQEEFQVMKKYLEDSKKQKDDFLDIMRQLLLRK